MTNSRAASTHHPGAGGHQGALAHAAEALEAHRRAGRQLQAAVEAHAHAVAEAIVRAPEMSADQIMIVNVSGRGDKDMMTVAGALGFET